MNNRYVHFNGERQVENRKGIVLADAEVYMPTVALLLNFRKSERNIRKKVTKNSILQKSIWNDNIIKKL